MSARVVQGFDTSGGLVVGTPTSVTVATAADVAAAVAGLGTGTVTSVSVVTANGFGGTVATPTTTPAITLTTSVAGLLKGNGAGVSAAVAGTDYLAPAGSGSALTGLTVSQVAGAAPLASPALTGTPTAPTATGGTNTTQVATTAFVTTAVSTAGGGYQPLDADLTAIAALTTTSFGRGPLTQASAAAARTTLGLDSAATHAAGDFLLAASNLSDLPSAATARANLQVDQSLAAINSVILSSWPAVAGQLYLCDASSANVTINLPASPADGDRVGVTALAVGSGYAVKLDAGSFTFDRPSGGSSTLSLAAGGQTAVVQYRSATGVWHSLVGAGYSSSGLLAANNLSDLPSAATARANLGLGTLATQSGTFAGTSSGTNTGDATAAGENYLTLSGQAFTAHAVDLSNSNATGTLAAARFPALTGAVTTAAGGLATTLAATQSGGHTWSGTQTFTLAPVFTDPSGSRTALGLGSLATQSGTFSGASSGTNTGDQTITLTGDVTGTGTGSFAATVVSASGTAAGKIQIASAAEVKAATSTAKAVTPGTVVAHPGVLKAWCRFSVTTGPAFNTLASYGIASVTRNGAGDYTFTFTTAFSSANYGVFGTGCHDTGGTVYVQPYFSDVVAPTATACRLVRLTSSGTAADPKLGSIAFAGDLVNTATPTVVLTPSATNVAKGGSVTYTITPTAGSTGGTAPWSYTLTPGDGSAAITGSFSGSSTTVAVTYNTTGTFTASCTVTDNAGNVSAATNATAAVGVWHAYDTFTGTSGALSSHAPDAVVGSPSWSVSDSNWQLNGSGQGWWNGTATGGGAVYTATLTPTTAPTGTATAQLDATYPTGGAYYNGGMLVTLSGGQQVILDSYRDAGPSTVIRLRVNGTTVATYMSYTPASDTLKLVFNVSALTVSASYGGGTALGTAYSIPSAPVGFGLFSYLSATGYPGKVLFDNLKVT